MKTCAKCRVEKEEIDFTTSQLKLNSGWCKSCISIKNKKRRQANPGYHKKWSQANPEKVKVSNKKYYQNNTEKIIAKTKKWQKENPEKVIVNSKKYYQNNTEKVIAKTKKWQKENPEKTRAKSKKWARANPEKVKEGHKKWQKENPDYQKQWRKENSERINAKRRCRYQNDLVYRNHCIASNMISKILKSQGSSKRGKSSHDYIPWTFQEYKAHIESLFEPWMNWNNQGVYEPKAHHLPNRRTWQLDHIIPQSDLPYPTMDHPNFNKTWDLSNLRPLDSKQNIIDGANRTRHKSKEK